jgi:hypothetical protein
MLYLIINSSSGNTIKDNIFYTTLSSVRGFKRNSTNSSENIVNYNLPEFVSNSRVWQDTSRTDFKTNYRSISGWDNSSGKCCDVDLGFLDAANGQYQLSSTSPAKNAGQNASCPSIDYDGDSRPQDTSCDIGVDEYMP